MRIRPFDDEPTPAQLAEIEREWPLIEAELALLDAEILCIVAPAGPTQLDYHRLRRAEAHVLHELRKFCAADRPEAGAA
ncbi:DUF6284 family protein [Dactylosporangium sp. CS-047395]|uniref:DUF6284 family protein n=1 Tax=Dactylosporangium sp. CS-047395 TaxID=3239936 RepID=UPI003D8BDC0A